MASSSELYFGREECWKNVTNVKPLLYVKNKIILTGLMGDLPIVIKIGNLDYSYGLRIISSLRHETPNLINVYCFKNISTLEILLFLTKFESIMFPEAEIIKKRIAEIRTTIPLTIELVKEYKTLKPRDEMYEAHKLIVSRLKTDDYKAYVEIMELVASPYNLNKFRSVMNIPMLASFSFQMVWTLICFLSNEAEHGDFYARNIWMQPIKKSYKYLVYRYIMISDKTFYLPLVNSNHYIMKIGDYELTSHVKTFSEFKEKVENARVILDQITYELQSLRNSCPDCKEVLQYVQDCLDVSKTVCELKRESHNIFSPIISGIFNEPLFLMYSKLPEDLTPENSITHENYYNPIIVNWDAMPIV